MELNAARSAFGVGDRRRRQKSAPKRVERADVWFRGAAAHGDAHAGSAQVNPRAGNDFVPSDKVVCHVGRQDGHIERVAGFDPVLEIDSEGGFDHEPAAGRAFENGGNLFQNAARRCTGENPGLDGLCGNALRQSQCGKDGNYCCGRRCVVNLRPHGAFP
jgi:hypothetical protein